jgi:hypothetical protein
VCLLSPASGRASSVNFVHLKRWPRITLWPALVPCTAHSWYPGARCHEGLYATSGPLLQRLKLFVIYSLRCDSVGLRDCDQRASATAMPLPAPVRRLPAPRPVGQEYQNHHHVRTVDEQSCCEKAKQGGCVVLSCKVEGESL